MKRLLLALLLSSTTFLNACGYALPEALEEQASQVEEIPVNVSEQTKQYLEQLMENLEEMQNWNVESTNRLKEYFEKASQGKLRKSQLREYVQYMQQHHHNFRNLMNKMPVPKDLPEDLRKKMYDGSFNISTGFLLRAEAMQIVLDYLNTGKRVNIQKYQEKLTLSNQFIELGLLEIMEVYYTLNSATVDTK